MIRLYSALFIIMLLPLSSYSQKCGFNVSDEEITAFEEFVSEKLRDIKIEEKKDSKYLIPVVVHVIHNGEAVGNGTNIGDQQIQSQIDVLNADFKRLNPDTILTPDIFKDVAGNPGIEFVLAYQDPEGNPTTGVTRHLGSKENWNSESDKDVAELQSIIHWPSEDYVNIYVTDISSSFIGKASFPEFNMLPGLSRPPDTDLDGVLVDYRFFGSNDYNFIFNLSEHNDKGRTLTHEMGHYFGLFHLWGNYDNADCNSTDYCEDTPVQDVETYNPLEDSVSCGHRKMFENYMDYTYDRYMNLFTLNQVQRMLTVLDYHESRHSLLSSHALEPIDPESRITAIDEGSMHNIKIYPNPVTGSSFFIESDIADFIEVGVIDMMGRLLQNKRGIRNVEINVEGLIDGLYLIRISNDKGVNQSRLINIEK